MSRALTRALTESGRRLVPALAIIMLFLTGCGTLDMKLETDVKASGDYTQSVTLTATGEIGQTIETEGGFEELSADGWTVNSTRTGDTLTMTASKDFSASDPFIFPAPAGVSSGLPAFDFDRDNYLVFSNFHLSLDIPADPEGPGSEFDEASLTFLQSFFTLSWTVTLPGDVIRSNADEVDGNSATWNFGITDLTRGMTMTADVRVIHWPVVFGGFALITVAAIVTIMLVRRNR